MIKLPNQYVCRDAFDDGGVQGDIYVKTTDSNAITRFFALFTDGSIGINKKAIGGKVTDQSVFEEIPRRLFQKAEKEYDDRETKGAKVEEINL